MIRFLENSVISLSSHVPTAIAEDIDIKKAEYTVAAADLEVGVGVGSLVSIADYMTRLYLHDSS